MRTLMQSLVGVTVLALFTGGMAAAQDKITLRFTQPWPSNHPQWLYGGQVFTDHVTKATNGQVEFEVYHAAQLGDDSLALLSSGLADVALISPNYAPDRFALSGVTELPGIFTGACEGSRKFREIATEGGALYENEYRALGLHPLYMAIPPAAGLMLASKQVDSLDDMQGLKIRAAGGAASHIVQELGGVPLQTVASELYDALSRGTIDGAMYYYVGMPSFSLEDVFHTGVDNLRFGAAAVFAGMDEDKWAELPQNVQVAMNEASLLAEQSMCAWFDENEQAIRDRLVAERGFTVTSLPPEDIEAGEDIQSRIADSWAKVLDESGRNASEVVQSFRDAQ